MHLSNFIFVFYSIITIVTQWNNIYVYIILMPINYVIGPSHIHKDFTHKVGNEIKNKKMFNNCVLDAYKGIPIWSRHIYTCISNNVKKNNNIFWIVSDYKFNNFDYPKILEIQARNELFLDTMGHPGNVSRDFLENRHIELLGNHSLKVIDYIISQFPNIKLIFWCLYKRTKANPNSSYPKHLWYDVIKEKYKDNIIDIDLFSSPIDFNLRILDEGGHPNKKGFILLDAMINGQKA